MDRRQFLREVFLWSAGATLAVPRFTILPSALAEERPQALLSVAKGEDAFALVARVLQPLGGMGRFVRPGDRVVVKPNIGWDRSPEQGANTHPQVVKAVVAAAMEAGAKQVLVFDRTCNEPRRCYANSGIEQAVVGNRGSLHHDLGQSLADLATVIRPKLTLIDATRILLDNGPNGGDLKDVRKTDTLIASIDPVAADAYATTLFGLAPDAIASTVAAYKLGLGEMALDRIKVLEA